MSIEKPPEKKSFLCSIGFHKLRYIEDHKWCMMSIAGCEHYRCLDCKGEYHKVYSDHPHTHVYPAIGARGSLR